ncbi:MAG: hypothetical protein PHV51_07560, partial [Methanosarcinaceae archaeon]|nr:hypothetical protein [Methanosarcinaceae archaeon]
PPGPTIPVGSDVIWLYNVTNTGNVNLTNITVTDDQGGVTPAYLSGDNGDNILEPGEVWTYNATGTAVSGQYANNGTATGDYNGFSVNDTDPSHYLGEEGPGPSIDIEKSTNGFDADTPPGPSIPVGNNVTWTYVVTNPGNVDLTNIIVTDDQGVTPVYQSGDDGDNILEPGEIWIYRATGNATLGPYANTGNATGQYNGTNYFDEDPSHYNGVPCDFLGPVYALSFTFPGAGPRFAFFDYNIGGGNVGAFDNSDSGYLDMDGDGIIDPNIDVRITPWHNVPANDSQFKYPANTKVANDDDQGRPLVVPGQQQVLYFIDLYGDGYDIEDPVYVDVNSAGLPTGMVEVHDIRLTANGWGYNAYTTVGAYDVDKGEILTLMPDNPDNPALQGTFEDLLGYIDDDCSTTWTCPDKLYLQQSKNNDTTGMNGDFDENANFFVTIGDLRIYIPPEAIANNSWPSCGTKVEEGDLDAVYTLSTPINPANGQIGVRIGFHDFSGGNGVFDGMDSAYIDIVNISDGSPGRVDNGDVRITPSPNVPEGHPDFKYPANTKVINDLDQGMPLLYPP